MLPWYRANHRALPWRATKDPYAVWLSEVVLQQTRVDQGLGYYQRFLQRWPTVQDLAKASEEQVLKQWQGLGYYSRARNLLAAAKQVVHQHDGKFPDTHKGLLELKGVGDYTASAVASICFNRAEAVVDGNVFRVLARLFANPTPIDSSEGRKEFKALAQRLLHPDAPGEHNQAMMELGALICTPRAPQCAACPLQQRCQARLQGTPLQYPVKAGKQRSRDRFFNYMHIPAGTGLYLQQRTAKDIWLGLYEPPLIESLRPLSHKGMATEVEKLFGPGWAVKKAHTAPPHLLSHQVVHAVFWSARPPSGFVSPAHWLPAAREEQDRLPVPRLIEVWMKALQQQKASTAAVGHS